MVNIMQSYKTSNLVYFILTGGDIVFFNKINNEFANA